MLNTMCNKLDNTWHCDLYLCLMTYFFQTSFTFVTMADADWMDVKSHLTSGLLDLLGSGRHVDTTIHVDGRSFKCHRVVLCAMSRYFDAMFSSGMLESQAGEVFLHNAQPAAFDLILHFMYGKNIEVSADNVCEILEMSSVYQIPALQSKCEKFLAKDLSTSNCLTCWKLSCIYSCSWIGDRAWEMILHNFKELSTTEEFQMLCKEDLIRIIADDRLQVENEEEVCKVVLHWLEHDPARMELLYEMFQHLKLPMMSQQFLESLPRSKKYIQDNSKLCALLNKFAHRHKPGLQSVNSTEDRGASVEMCRDRSEDVLVMVDGRRQEVVCFSLQRRKLFTLAKFPYFADGKAACVHLGDIFVSGGVSSNLEKRLVRFNSKRNRWDECCTMQEGRSYHNLVSMQDHLYSLSGFVGNDPVASVECYTSKDNTWTKVGSLAMAVGGISAAALGDTIYMFGGKRKRHEQDTALFQSFDTRTSTACILNALPLRTCWSQAIVVDEVIHIFCPNGHVLGFDKTGPPGIVAVSPKLDVNYFSVVHHRGTFLVIQVGDAKYHDEVRVFHPETGEVQIMHERLPRSLSDSKWMKVTINRQHLKYECSHHTHSHR